LAALWAGNKTPSDAEIQSTVDIVAKNQSAALRTRLEDEIRSAKSRSTRRRLRAKLHKVFVPPQVSPARQLAESYTVDTDPECFIQRHQEYLKAQRDQLPVMYFVGRRGEPLTVEFHAPPLLPSTSRRPPAGGRRRKLSLEALANDIRLHPGSDILTRADRLEVSPRTISSRLLELRSPRTPSRPA